MANSPRLGLFDSKKGLIQVVADNFDTKISSRNGQKSTHGLAMIITQASMRTDLFKRKIAGKCHAPPKQKSLPPTMAAFKLHCQRAYFQTALWKAASMSTPPITVWLGDKRTRTSTTLYLTPESWLHRTG
jgi:hypothetical protein